ncbi:MAG: N-formylglutamate amidohydrolase [Rhodobacteraceae bacterium]|nr:N-formylglutamate amidohydrolase [Paracoccaceae bacterium]
MPDQNAFEIFSHNDASPILIICDHASNFVPDCVNGGTLGISDQDMNRHIAFDIGAKAVSEYLAKALNATMLSSRFSRLVIDPNRGEDDPTILMKIYDGTIIPGNRHADNVERERRLAKFHRPYHRQIAKQIAAITARGQTPVMVSIHSYTPKLQNRPKRPWHVGVLWDQDARIPVPLLEKLRANPDICVGDNEPYSGELRGDTMYFHATEHNLPHVLIELRHDLIDTEKGQQKWAEILSGPLREIIDNLENNNG